MKFGRYLTENQTPEWKRAYIDYRSCKKAIKIIATRLGQKDDSRAGDVGDAKDSSDADEDNGPSRPRQTPTVFKGAREGDDAKSALSPGSRTVRGQGVALPSQGSRLTSPRPGYGATASSPRAARDRPAVPPPLDLGESSYPSYTQTVDPGLSKRFKSTAQRSAERPSEDITKSRSPRSSTSSRRLSSGGGMETSDSGQHLTATTPAIVKSSPKLGKSSRFAGSPKPSPTSRIQPSPQSGRSLRSMTLPSPRLPKRTARTLEELCDGLQEDEQAFFDILQHELEKVQSFYTAREEDAQKRAREFRVQLRELGEHRKVFHELYPSGVPEWEAKVGRILPGYHATATANHLTAAAKSLHLRIPFVNESEENSNGRNGDTKHAPSSGGEDVEGYDLADETSNEVKKQRLRTLMKRDGENETYDPERYQKYKKSLRMACVEFYRTLELIKNYRIMNLTGFRKALKKFEKTTKIHCMELYTDEKISRESFATGEVIDDLLDQMEKLYTEHFEHGDPKKARDKLRKQTHEKQHYSTVLRSGLYIGLGLPVAIIALVQATKDETHRFLPAWDGLLQVYAALYLPVVFAMLFELNIIAWVSSRINYEFVMELSKPSLDHRAFGEIPSFLFLTLSYAFFFSYINIGPPHIAVTTWPAAWLVFVAVFFLNPVDLFRRNTRFWFLKVLFRVCTPGYSRVEFIAFFLADELNSLVYSIQNIYFMSCAYAHNWPPNLYTVCPSGRQWPYALLLCLPALSRLIQCLKRYWDSNLWIHLINAGKYLSSIGQFCLFVFWRSRGSVLKSGPFIAWIIVAIISATYTSAWDLIVDWSLFRRGSHMLRRDRGYGSNSVYYFAMVTNVLIRFVFIWYLPLSDRHVRLRSFIFAAAEMLRRWQWNFFRVETEHLGNADAYRVTREIPLPYRRVHHDSEDDSDEALRRIASNPKSSIALRLRNFKQRVIGEGKGRGPDQINAGPRGHHHQREYEARRPGDTPRTPRSGEESEV